MDLSDDEPVKPWLDDARARGLLKAGFGYDANRVAELESFDDRNFRMQLASEDPEIKKYPHGFVLKVTNWKESSQRDFIESVCEMLSEISKTVPCQVPVQTKEGRFFFTEVFPIGGENSELKKECVVRVFSFLPGRTLDNMPLTPRACLSWGSLLGRLHVALQELTPSAAFNRYTPWSVLNVPELKPLVDTVLDDPEDRALVKDVLYEFDRVLPDLRRLPLGILHGDLNEKNVLTNQADDQVYAVLDWGDVHVGPRILDLAVMLAYVLIAPSPDGCPLKNVGLALATYLEHVPAERHSLLTLKTLIASRLCQSLVLGLYAYQRDPTNEYVLYTQKNGWTMLRELWTARTEDLAKIWNGALHDRNIKPLVIGNS